MTGKESKSRCKIIYQKISQNIQPNGNSKTDTIISCFYYLFFMSFQIQGYEQIKETNSIVTRNSQFHSLGFNSWISPRILSGLVSVITIPYRQTDLSGAFGRDSFIPTHSTLKDLRWRTLCSCLCTSSRRWRMCLGAAA